MSDGKRKINQVSSTKNGANKKKAPVKVKQNNKHKEISAIILCAIGVFMVFSLFGKTGIIGQLFIGLFKGLFGSVATIILTLLVFVLSWSLLRGTENSVFSTKRCVLIASFTLLLSTLLHTLGSNYSEEYASLSFFQLFEALWKSNLGGVIGGGISCILQKFFEKAGALVVLIPSILVLAVFLFSFSVSNVADKAAVGAKSVGNWFKGVKERFKEDNNKENTSPATKNDKKQKPVRNDIQDNVRDEVDEALDNSFNDMNDAYTMDFEFETSANRKRKKRVEQAENLHNDEELNKEPVEAIPTILPGMDETVETISPPKEATELKITTSKFDTIYDSPAFSLLNANPESDDLHEEHRKQAARVARKLEAVMRSFGVEAKVIHISRGSTVTQYELQPHSGVKVSRIKNLSDDIALNLAAPGIRIEAPIPGKAAIGIEIPNEEVQTVFLRDLIETDTFMNHKSSLAFCVGEEISGRPIIADIAKMPHLLIAGSTGSGKSVCINCMIVSILYKASPDDVRMIMIDPKVVELGIYNGIPHLLIPVVTEPKKAAAALAWAVQEMENRYKQFAKFGLREITAYNNYAYENNMDKMPRILIVIDELADLMMVARDSVEDAINRLAAKARAAGLHLVVATQRPSVDVITGLIKANIPSRIAFKVASQVDSRTILDFAGAEKLLGRGDMLYHPVGALQATRAQGGFVSDEEIENVVKFLQTSYGEAVYDEQVSSEVENAKIPEKGKKGSLSASSGADSDVDELFYDALQIAIDTKQISASFLQRKLGLGYSRASRIIDQLESKGYISCRDGNNPRQVLISQMPENVD